MAFAFAITSAIMKTVVNNCTNFSDNHDDLFDDDGPPNKYKEFSDDFRDEEFTEVERTQTISTEKITTGKEAYQTKDLNSQLLNQR